eukprot:6186953-Pleurochrysis_carterae.AAC.4
MQNDLEGAAQSLLTVCKGTLRQSARQLQPNAQKTCKNAAHHNRASPPDHLQAADQHPTIASNKPDSGVRLGLHTVKIENRSLLADMS